MMKRKLTLHIRIPAYRVPRNTWRQVIHAEVLRSAEAQRVTYETTDRLELAVTLCISEEKLGWHDVDNRLKDIMDALQGRAGGSKAKRKLNPIIPNDNQIYRVTIEKKRPPPQSLGLGHITIRKYNSANPD